MANFFDPTYDPQKDSASSAGEVSDLNPERIYDTDLRRIEEDKRGDVENINQKQGQVAKYMKAAKTAGAYKTRAGIAEPTLRGKTPRNPAIIDVSSFGTPFGGTVLPSMGDSVGRAGSTNYADKPKQFFGQF
jgi:hypothetical protein